MLIALLVPIALAFLLFTFIFVRAVIAKSASPSVEAMVLGAVTNFFDTLGIGSFAPTMAWFKFRNLLLDRLIPPTMLVGHSLPTFAQAFIYLMLLGVLVDPVLIVGCALALVLGGLVGAPMVAKAKVWLVQLAVAIALLVAQQRQREGRGLPDWRWIGLWALLLLGLKLASAAWPTHKDASQCAPDLRPRTPAPIEEVVLVEHMARYGLHIELGAEVEKLSLDPEPAAPRFNPDNDADLAQELGEHERNVVWITKQARFPQVRARMQAAGYRVVPQGAPYQRRVIFVVEPLAP